MSVADVVVEARGLTKLFLRSASASGRGYATGGVPGDLAMRAWLKLRRQLVTKPTRALDGVDLEVRRGSFVGLLGPNGAGKSTLLRLIAGLTSPTSGQLAVFGLDPARYRREVLRRTNFIAGALTGGVWVDPDLTARRNLRLMGDLFGLPAARMDEVLEQVGLADAADRRVGTFSSGMAARLQLAFGLLRPAELLVLDEPTEGLSPDAVRSFHRHLQRLRVEEGATIVYASHHLAELEPVVTEVVLLAKGKVVAQGEIQSLASVVDGGEHITIDCAPAPNGALDGISSLPGVHDVTLAPPRRDDASARIELTVAHTSTILPVVLSKLIEQDRCTVCNVEVHRLGLSDVYRWFVEGKANAAVTQ